MAYRPFSSFGLVVLLFACGSSDDGTASGFAGSGGATAGSGAVAGGSGAAPGGQGGTPSGGAGGASAGGTAGGGTGGSSAQTAAACFLELPGGDVVPDYDQFSPTVGTHCSGTAHQQIEGVERLVFLGDSVSNGTPPTPADQFYRTVLAAAVQTRFGASVQVDSCAENGARNDDLMTQIGSCFPDGGDDRVTLTVFTMGGNDAAAWAGDGLTTEDAIAQADIAAGLLDDAVAFLKDPVRFPAGSFVVFANVYEYTDGTADLSSCPAAIFAGLSGTWAAGIPAIVHFEERYMEVAIRHDADMIFMMENFCGHGYRRDDPAGPCYRGPGAELWFDLTCIHPTPTGHQVIADLFMDVIGR